MAGQTVTHVLLDFFGTLVRYSPSRTEQGYHASHALAASMGATIDYQDFLQAWAAESALFDERSAVDDSEFSMEELGAAFLSRILRRDPAPAETAAFVDEYVREWNTAVVYPPGVAELVAALANRFRLAVVTNTHKADLVPGHLSAMGIAHHFDAVVTSVEVGWRKPHPAIYAEALLRLGATAGNVVFAGDSYAADYLGPAAAGLTAFLIDPGEQHTIPPERRLRSLHDLAVHLGTSPRAAG
jgi:putative hydrolase of the HAD superfamily